MPYSYNWHTQDQDAALKNGWVVHSNNPDPDARADLKSRIATSQTVRFVAKLRISSNFLNKWQLYWAIGSGWGGRSIESPDSIEVWNQRELDWERVNYDLSGVPKRVPASISEIPGRISVFLLGVKTETELEFWDFEHSLPIWLVVPGRIQITAEGVFLTQSEKVIGSMKESQYERQKHRFRLSAATHTLAEFVKESRPSPSMPMNVVHTKSATAFLGPHTHTPSSRNNTDDIIQVDLLFTKDFPRYNKSEEEFATDLDRFRNNLWWTLHGLNPNTVRPVAAVAEGTGKILPAVTARGGGPRRAPADRDPVVKEKDGRLYTALRNTVSIGVEEVPGKREYFAYPLEGLEVLGRKGGVSVSVDDLAPGTKALEIGGEAVRTLFEKEVHLSEGAADVVS